MRPEWASSTDINKTPVSKLVVYRGIINDVTLWPATAILSVTLYRSMEIPRAILAHNNIRLYTNLDKHMRSDKKVIISHFYMVIVR